MTEAARSLHSDCINLFILPHYSNRCSVPNFHYVSDKSKLPCSYSMALEQTFIVTACLFLLFLAENQYIWWRPFAFRHHQDILDITCFCTLSCTALHSSSLQCYYSLGSFQRSWDFWSELGFFIFIQWQHWISVFQIIIPTMGGNNSRCTESEQNNEVCEVSLSCRDLPDFYLAVDLCLWTTGDWLVLSTAACCANHVDSCERTPPGAGSDQPSCSALNTTR